MAKGDVLVRMKADVSGYDANIAKARRQLENFKKDNLSLGGVMKQTQGALLATAARFASVTAAVGALGAAFMDNIATARKFEVSMSQLSSLTGMVGADLAKLKDYAIELGSSTTLSASQVADAFKMIGSQQPQLLASGEALKSVTKNAITLAEAAGIDLATAAQTLSTSINQMGGDSGNAERYINVLAAASQKGAGDIAWLGEAITKSGTTAKAVGTDYEELVANLEQLAKAGFDASTAGTALRSIIMNLEKQANNDFKPSVVGLTQAFENLGKANLSIVGYQEIAGKMFASQAKALADAAGEARDMTSAITGTNTAEEQAKTNTDNLEGSIKALSSAWEGFNLHLNSSNGIFRDIVDGLKDVVVWADNVITKLGEIPNPENIITKNLKEVGPNVDDNGNYIKRPAQKGAVGFDWENGTWMKGYTGAIYNGATGQTEFPEVEVVGNKITKGGGGKNNKTKKTKTEPVYVEGSLAAQSKLVSDLTKKWNEAGAEVRSQYVQPLVEAEEKLKEMKNEQALLKEQAQGRLNGVNLWQGDIDDIAGGPGKRPQFAGGIPEIGKGLETLPQHLSPLQEMNYELSRMKELLEYAPDTQAYQDALQKIADKEKEISQFKGESSMSDEAKDSEKAWQKTASAISQVGSALKMIEDPTAQVMSIIAEAIANIALTFSKSLKGTVTPWDWIAAAAAGTATMISTIAAIKQVAVGSYAQGGVIPGNSFSGDNQWARVNAGETILTQAQTGILASQLENAGIQNLRLDAYVTGEQIRLVLNNNSRRTGKGEYVQFKG